MKKILLALLTITLLACADKDNNTNRQSVDHLVEIGCGEIVNPFVMFTAGQSNAANNVNEEYTPYNPVFVYNNGRCYYASDPLPGADGFGGSVWTRLADKILDSTDNYSSVVIVATAVGGSSSFEWTNLSPNYNYALYQFTSAQVEGLQPNVFLWHQGESDAYYGSTPREYVTNVSSMINGFRSNGVGAPTYVAQTSYCHGLESQDIRDAQAFLTVMDGVYIGPNTDNIGSEYRYDDCHFNEQGADIHASMWNETLRGMFND